MSGAVGAFISFTPTKLPRQINTFDDHPTFSPQAGSHSDHSGWSWTVRMIVGPPSSCTWSVRTRTGRGRARTHCGQPTSSPPPSPLTEPLGPSAWRRARTAPGAWRRPPPGPNSWRRGVRN